MQPITTAPLVSEWIEEEWFIADAEHEPLEEWAEDVAVSPAPPAEDPRPVDPTPPEPVKASAPAPAAPKRRRGANTTPRPDPITEADADLIRASANNMRDWLLYGIEKLRHPDREHPPSPGNWRQWSDEKIDAKVNWKAHIGAANWTPETLQNFYWYRLSLERAALNLPLTIPKWSRLRSTINELVKSYGIAGACEYLHVLTGWWFTIRKLVGGRAGETMLLTETTPTHGLVQQQVGRLMNMSYEERERYEQWAKGR